MIFFLSFFLFGNLAGWKMRRYGVWSPTGTPLQNFGGECTRVEFISGLVQKVVLRLRRLFCGQTTQTRPADLASAVGLIERGFLVDFFFGAIDRRRQSCYADNALGFGGDGG